MHSSIARAFVKGKVRGAKTNLCKFKDVLDNSVPLSGKKNTLRFFKWYCDSFEQLLIAKLEKKKRSSWHKKLGVISVMPKPSEIGGIGKIHPVAVQFLCTRNYVKDGSNSFAEFYYPRFCMHEHFMLRILQRRDSQDINVINELILKSLTGCSLVNERFPADEGSHKRAFHILADKYIVIVTFHSLHNLFVFNTVLRTEQFSDQQRTFYFPLMDLLKQGGNKTGIYSINNGELLGLDFDMNYDAFYQSCKKMFPLPID